MPHKILIVDEVIDLLEILAAIVQRAGYTAITLRDGADLPRTAEREIPSLILIDVFNSRKDWGAVFEALSKNPITKGIPVLTLNERVGSLHTEQGFPLSANDYLIKPLSPAALIQKIQARLPSIEM